jgi:hypothetical protein
MLGQTLALASRCWLSIDSGWKEVKEVDIFPELNVEWRRFGMDKHLTCPSFTEREVECDKADYIHWLNT